MLLEDVLNFDHNQRRNKGGKWVSGSSVGRMFEKGGPVRGLSEQEKSLKDYVGAISQFSGGRGVQGLVEEHGQFFKPPKSTDDNRRLMKEHGITRGQAKECFSNAGKCVLDIATQDQSLTYVEGFASGSTMPVHHAWLVDPTGQVIDITWRGQKVTAMGAKVRVKPGSAYYGVPLNNDYVTKVAAETGFWGVFDSYNEDLMDGKLPPEAIRKITINTPFVRNRQPLVWSLPRPSRVRQMFGMVDNGERLRITFSGGQETIEGVVINKYRGRDTGEVVKLELDGGRFIGDMNKIVSISVNHGRHNQKAHGIRGSSGGGATLEYADGISPQDVRAVLGHDPDLIVGLVGAQPGSKVTVTEIVSSSVTLVDDDGEFEFDFDNRFNSIAVAVEGPGYSATRYINSDKTILNYESGLDSDNQGQGTGTRVLVDQVNAAADLGYKSIGLVGERGKDTNGYYTWPRLGFDAKVPTPEKFGYPPGSWLSSLMVDKRGQAEWKKKGTATLMEFDLTKHSLNRRVLNAYAKRKFGGSSTTNRGRRGDSGRDLGRGGESGLALHHGKHNQKSHGRRGAAAGAGQTHKMLSRLRTDTAFTFVGGQEKFKDIGTDGYAVSPYPELSTKFERKITVKDLREFMDKNADTLKKKGHALGAWHDTNSGVTFLDVSVVTGSKNEAIKLGRKHNQISAFDFKRGEEISTGGTGEAISNLQPDGLGGNGRGVGEYIEGDVWDSGRGKVGEVEWYKLIPNTENFNPFRDGLGRFASGGSAKFSPAEIIGGFASDAVDVLDATFDQMDPISDVLDHARESSMAIGVGTIPEKMIKSVYVAGNLADMLTGTEIGTIGTTAALAVATAMSAISNAQIRIRAWKSDKKDQIERKRKSNREQRTSKRRVKAKRKRGRLRVMNTAEEERIAGNRMAEIWGLASRYENPKAWLMYFILSRDAGSDDEESEALADLLMEEDGAKLSINHQPGKHSQKSHGGRGGRTTVIKGETLDGVVRNPETKKWDMDDGTKAPSHVDKIGIPPAWTDVHANMNPEGTRMASGFDEKGRLQGRYSATHNSKQAAAKFGRTSELRKKRRKILNEINKDATNPKLKERAECLKVIIQTGMRPGSTKDTKADHVSYGATTLLGKHIVVNANGVVTIVAVTGKSKGVKKRFVVKDKKTAQMLIERKNATGPNGSLFKTSAGSVLAYSKTKDGGGFKTKDFRTALGTEVAIKAMKGMRTSYKTKKAYKAAVKKVATKVSKTLGNTPNVAVKSYIDPLVWNSWSVSA